MRVGREMDPLDVQPWLEDCLEAIEPRRGERVLQIGGHPRPLTEVLRQAVGAGGNVLVVEPDRAHAELAACDAAPGVDVVCTSLSPTPSVGRHDAVIGSLEEPAMLPDPAEFVRLNLRPGGRFVLDLPAAHPCSLLDDMWRRVGGDPDVLERWSSSDDEALCAALEEIGMRDVDAVVATSLVRADSPRTLAAWWLARLGEADPDVLDTLAIVLAERLQSAGPCEVAVHRMRVRGIF